jgi:metal-responsive CopG/Arc/MetJ family transcriptional regulator
VRKNRPPEPGMNIGVRLQSDQLDQLDAWIAKQEDKPSRPEAIRRILAKALGR